jgi:hypothetical protein
MAKPNYMVQISDPDIEPMIKTLAAEDLSSLGNQARSSICLGPRMRVGSDNQLKCGFM